jgi:DNA-binding transcriptional LysR family regulator
MRIETLKVFCDLVETESFSEAAERSGITQSAVSQRISSLEKEFGAVMVERGKKSFGLTPEGRVFLEGSREMLETLKNTLVRLHDLRNLVAGTLRLSTVYSIGLHELSPHLKRYREEFPQVDLQVSYRKATQIYSDVIEGRADVGFISYPKERKGVVVESYWRDKLVMICAPGHRLGKRKRLKLSELGGENFVAYEPDAPTRQAMDTLFEEEEVKVNEVMEFDNVETVKRAVEVEGMISIIPQKSASGEVKAGQLRTVAIDHEEMWRPLGIIRKRTKAVTPSMREFVELLKGVEEL